MIEIHGLRACPFAWRVRLAAREKGLRYDWIAYDAPEPDPRAAQHNAERKSPKIWEDGYSLIESLVISQYLDEAHPGRRLQPEDARARAALRLRLELIAAAIVGHVTPELPADARLVGRVQKGHRGLDQALSQGDPWMGGLEPDLSDLMIWPFLVQLEEAGVRIPDRFGRARAYLERVRTHPSFTATDPTSEARAR